MLISKELIKNHLTVKGDVAENIETFLVRYGEIRQKRFFSGLLVFALLPVFFLWNQTRGSMYFHYFLLVFVFMNAVLFYLYRSGKYPEAYQWNKWIIVSGVFSLFLL
jgi:4-hydroxybenzoate polyprenyltransferase